LTGNSLSQRAFAELTPRLKLGLTQIPIRRNPHPADAGAVWHVTRRVAITGA
jgi:hypothetical protein